jgi:branched-chain amino acid transport system substrate-binding protein
MILRRFSRCLLGSVVVAAGLLGAAVSAESAGAATAQPIVIGDICSCTGAEASSIAPSTPTIQAWAKSVNASGGIQGHPVQVIVKDDALNPAVSLAAAKSLVAQDHVVAILDNSDEDTAWASYVEQNHVPVDGGLVGPIGSSNPDFFPPGATEINGPSAMAHLASLVHAKKVAVLYCAEAATCQEAVTALKPAFAKVGLEQSYVTSISFSAPSYTAQCLAAKESGATAMIVADATTIVTNVATQCATQGFKPPQLGGNSQVSTSLLTVPAMNGSLDYQFDLPFFVHNSATKPMYAALSKYAPGVVSGPNMGEQVLATWASGVLLQTAAKATHLSATPTAKEFLAGLYAMPKGSTLGGLTGPLTFTKGQPNPQSCYFFMGIKSGKFVSLNDDKYTCFK